MSATVDPVPGLAYIQGTYQTAQQLLSDVGVEIGLPASPNPFTSTDTNYQQLVIQANLVGKDLLRKWDWQLFQRTHSILTVSTPPPTPSSPTYYPMPADYFKYIDQTGWNRTARLPMAGPLTPQAYEWLVGLVSNSFTIYLGFRLWSDVFAIYPSPNPNGQEIAFEYLSRNWVQPVASLGTNPPSVDARTNFVANNGDVVLYDSVLFGRALKLRWLTDKGFDTTAASDDLQAAFEQAVGPDMGGQKLNLAQAGWGMRYLDAINNVPPSGFGQM